MEEVREDMKGGSTSILSVFRQFDEDGDGEIHRDELARVLRLLDPTVWDDSSVDYLISCADSNGDGKIQYEEFITWIGSVDCPMPVKVVAAKCSCGAAFSSEYDFCSECGEKRPSVEREPAKDQLGTVYEAWTWLPVDRGFWLKPGHNPLVAFTKDDKTLLRNYFEMHDADLSGTMSFGEVMQVLRDLGREPKTGTNEKTMFSALEKKAIQDHGDQLDFDNFIGLLEAYYHAVYRGAFSDYTKLDDCPAISKGELQAALAELISAGFNVPWHKVEDVMDSADMDSSGTIDFEEFCHLMMQFRALEFAHVRRYSGFDRFEFENLSELFRSADLDKSGFLTISELGRVVQKTVLGDSLNSQETLDRFVKLFTRIDRDKNCCLDFEEFLRLLRVWGNGTRELLVGGAITEAADDRRQAVARRVSAAMMSIEAGDTSASHGVAQALGDDVEDAVLAQQCDLQVAEVRILRESFEFCDADGSGSIDGHELPDLLKNLGCAAHTSAQMAALESCRQMSKFSGDLDFVHVLRFIELYYAAVATEVINAVATVDDGIPLDQLVPALYQAGMYMNQDNAQKLLQEARKGLELSDGSGVLLEEARRKTACSEAALARMLKIQRKRRQLEWRKSYGFDTAFVQRVELACSKHAEDGGVHLENVFAVLEDLERLPSDQAQRRVLARALARVDHKDDRLIPVEEFLLLLRHLENHVLKNKTQSEITAAQACGLDSGAVAQLREVWKEHDPDDRGEIPVVGVHVIFKDLGVVRNGNQRKVLTRTLKDVVGKGASRLTFLQFLQILHSLDVSGEF